MNVCRQVHRLVLRPLTTAAASLDCLKPSSWAVVSCSCADLLLPVYSSSRRCLAARPSCAAAIDLRTHRRRQKHTQAVSGHKMTRPPPACCTGVAAKQTVQSLLTGTVPCWPLHVAPCAVLLAAQDHTPTNHKCGSSYLSCASSLPSSASCCPRSPSRLVSKSSRRALAGPAVASRPHAAGATTASVKRQTAKVQLQLVTVDIPSTPDMR